MTETLQLEAPAKINLWLKIHGRREDGFHEVSSRMARLRWADRVTVSLNKSEDSVAIACSDRTVAADESNLAVRAVRAFQRRVSVGGGWRIELEKRIPAGAGLGGGSSDAAAVLLAANRLWGHPLEPAELVALAGEIGSDVAFFALETAVADATGRGEVVTPVQAAVPEVLLLIKPNFPVPTPWAYQNWQGSGELPGVLYAPQVTEWGALVNDLERPVFEKYRLLPTLKMWLLEQPECEAALMSGSGSTVFAVAESLEAAGQLRDKARDLVGDLAFVEVTQTV